MADKTRNTFTTRPKNNEISDQRRVSEQMTESRDTSEPTSPGTATSPVPHVVEPHRPMEVEQTDRQTTDQNVQGDWGSQLMPGSSLNVVGSQGPVQLGTGSTVINNPTYYNDNSQHHHHHHHYHRSPYHTAYHNDYLRWVEQNAAVLGSGPSHPELPPCPVPQSRDNDQLEDQTSRSENITDRNISAQSQTERKTLDHADHHGDKSSYHVPCHCKDCQHYHNNDHQPLAESRPPHQESESRHLVCPHHPLPQILPSTQQSEKIKPTNRRGNVTDRRRQENAISTDREIENKKSRPSQVRLGRRSSNSPRKPASDVTLNTSRADQRVRNGPQTSTTADRESIENANTQTTPPAGTRPPSVSVTHDTVSVIDSEGQVLETGDYFWTLGPGYHAAAIYVGQQMLVRCDWKTGSKMVKKEQLCMTAPFGKCTVYSNECPVYSPRERVDRATAWIGKRFTEGYESDGSDFPWWVYTGLGFDEALEKGFLMVL